MNLQLLGGWRDVVDDVELLETTLEALPDSCTCGHGSAYLSGICPCCRAGERALDSSCIGCEAMLATIRDEMDQLVDATLRFLPFVETMLVTGPQPNTRTDVIELRRRILNVAAMFQHLETAGGQFREGCTASHIVALKILARDLVTSARALDTKLMAIAVQGVARAC